MNLELQMQECALLDSLISALWCHSKPEAIKYLSAISSGNQTSYLELRLKLLFVYE